MKKSYTAAFNAQILLELLKETRTLNQLASEYGVHPNVPREWKHATIKALPDVFERRASLTEARAAYQRQIEDLYAEIARLTTHINADALALITQAELLGISRRSLSYQPKPPPPQEVAIKHRIDELYTARPSMARAN